MHLLLPRPGWFLNYFDLIFLGAMSELFYANSHNPLSSSTACFSVVFPVFSLEYFPPSPPALLSKMLFPPLI